MKEITHQQVNQTIQAVVKFVGKMMLKIAILSSVGVLISFVLYQIKDIEMGASMRIIGAIIALIGLSSVLGQFGMRNDYNYNMSKMRDSKIRELEHDGFMTASSLSFLIWWGLSGTLLFFLGDAMMRA